jgi:hypothetical protein
MPRLELFPFRHRDPRTRKWSRARYRAERHEIAELLVPSAPVRITARESTTKRETFDREFDADTGLGRSSDLPAVKAISQLHRLADIEADFLKLNLRQSALDLFQFVFGHRGLPVCLGEVRQLDDLLSARSVPVTWAISFQQVGSFFCLLQRVSVKVSDIATCSGP